MVAVGGQLALASSWATPHVAAAPPADGPYGPLGPADANGMRLPDGFRSRIIATTGEVVASTDHVWHANPDGGATFATDDGGWIYVSNAETSGGRGGAGAVVFAADGTVTGAHPILSGTNLNCAGGPTPWGTWLSCEELEIGQVWECDPTGATPAAVRPAMGRFPHEAAAVDPGRRVVYLTEDRPDGGLYRFVPERYPDLSTGRLQVLVGDDSLAWHDVPAPDSTDPPTRHQVPGMRRFDGGEGAWFHGGRLWFTTKGDGRVWILDDERSSGEGPSGGGPALTVAYDDSTAEQASLTGVDNVTVARTGDVFVAEDGGNLEVCLLVPRGAVPFLRVEGVSGSELTGPAFSPDGRRLYVSSQRNPGRTYEVTGPFRGSVVPPELSNRIGRFLLDAFSGFSGRV